MAMASLTHRCVLRTACHVARSRRAGPDRLHLLGTQAAQPPGKNSEPERDKEFEINYGRAVDRLRDDLPEAFIRRPTTDIYHPTLVFESPILKLTSLSAYLWGLACMRTGSSMLFSDRTLSVSRVWSPSYGVLKVRCTVTAMPRGRALMGMIQQTLRKANNSSGASPIPTAPPLQWDLLFTYEFSSKGLINLHRVELVVPLDQGTPALVPEVPIPLIPVEKEAPGVVVAGGMPGAVGAQEGVLQETTTVA